MPLVFDNIVFNLQRAGGISRFWSKIIAPHVGLDHATFIEHAGVDFNIYRRDMKVFPVAQDHALPLSVARYLNFSRKFGGGPHVFHSSYFRVNTAPGCINVTTVHDLIYEKFGSGLGTRLHLHQKRKALEISDCIVCVSEHTRKDLLEHYPFCEKKRIEVVPNGVEGFAPVQRDDALLGQLGIGDLPYFLYVGNRGSCKGFDRVYDALDLVNRSLRCIVVGAPFSPAESAAIRARGHEDIVVNAGKVSDEELNALYSSAAFFFFPSLYEGFGIPPLEAMLAGCPVLASNRSSVPEVIGEAGILFDPDDSESLRVGLQRVLTDGERGALVAAGRLRARSFGWDSVVRRYAALYEQLEKGVN